MAVPDADDILHTAAAERRELKRDVRQIMLSGVVLTVPFLVTALVLIWALNFLADALSPVVGVLVYLTPIDELGPVVPEVLAAVVVAGSIFTVGLAAQHGPDTTIGKRLDVLMQDLPGVGSIYTGVERMSEVLLESDSDSFREVKLVEFPTDDSWSLAFLTADTPEAIEESAGEEEMQTVFVPMAPNPVMGGHLLSLPADRVHDVDLTVEQGMEAVMTTGLAIDQSAMEEEMDAEEAERTDLETTTDGGGDGDG
jgi:uncharacterized membrane protein